MRRFIDTNVFVYCFDPTDPAKRDLARSIVRESLDEGNGWCSSQVVQEFVNVALRRFSKVLSVTECRKFLREVLIPLCGIYPSPEIYEEALGLSERHSFSWYDSLILAGALALDCDELCSEDMQHGMRIGGLTIRNPFARAP